MNSEEPTEMFNTLSESKRKCAHFEVLFSTNAHVFPPIKKCSD